jgi:predicted nucleic acid-binding protein
VIIVDTNVVSELQGRLHTDHLLRWLNAQDREAVFLPTIVIAEIRYGLGLLADGRRKRSLFTEFYTILVLFEGRIVGFSIEAAHRYGMLMAHRKTSGVRWRPRTR